MANGPGEADDGIIPGIERALESYCRLVNIRPNLKSSHFNKGRLQKMSSGKALVINVLYWRIISVNSGPYLT